MEDAKNIQRKIHCKLNICTNAVEAYLLCCRITGLGLTLVSYTAEPSLSACKIPTFLRMPGFLYVYMKLLLKRKLTLYSTLDHAFHDLLLCDKEDDDHWNDCKQSSGKNSVPTLYVRSNELLDCDRDCHNLTVLSKHH